MVLKGHFGVIGRTCDFFKKPVFLHIYVVAFDLVVIAVVLWSFDAFVSKFV